MSYVLRGILAVGIVFIAVMTLKLIQHLGFIERMKALQLRNQTEEIRQEIFELVEDMTLQGSGKDHGKLFQELIERTEKLHGTRFPTSDIPTSDIDKKEGTNGS